MKVLPVSTPINGLRSAAFQVIVGQTRLFFNPGVAAVTKDGDFTIGQARASIVEAAGKAHAILVTDYDASHHNLLQDLPLSAILHLKAPITPSDWATFRSELLPLGGSGQAISLADGSQFSAGDADIAWSPKNSNSTMVTVRGDGRTLVYATQTPTTLTPNSLERIVGEQADLLYLDITPEAGAEAWSSVQLTSLAGKLLGLVATTGSRILIEGLPLGQPACRRLFQAPMATGRVAWAAEYTSQRAARPTTTIATLSPTEELALAS